MKTIIALFSMVLITATAGFSQSIERDVVASSGDYFEGANASLSWTLGEIAVETYTAGNNILTQGFQQPSSLISGITLDLNVFLEGPFLLSEMGNDLNAGGNIPLAQPYNTAPWNYTGTESVSSIPSADIVDWIFIELRETAGGASSATAATMIAQQAAFILKDGSIVDLDGVSAVQNAASVAQNLFVVVYHRNHLGVMSANPLTLAGGIYTYDFSNASGQVYGGVLGHKEVGTGIWGMVGGDGDADGQIGNPDKNDVWAVQAGFAGYYAGDFNMDVQVNNLDKNDVWAPNGGIGSQVPDFLTNGGYQCQIP